MFLVSSEERSPDAHTRHHSRKIAITITFPPRLNPARNFETSPREGASRTFYSLLVQQKRLSLDDRPGQKAQCCCLERARKVLRVWLMRAGSNFSFSNRSRGIFPNEAGAWEKGVSTVTTNVFPFVMSALRPPLKCCLLLPNNPNSNPMVLLRR